MTIVKMDTDTREIFMARQRRGEMTVIKGKEMTQLYKRRVYGKTEREDKVECGRRVLMAGQRRMEKVLLCDPMVDTSMADDDDASPGGGMPYT